MTERVNANGRSMGMALTSCTVPAAGRPTFTLGDEEMEKGWPATVTPLSAAMMSFRAGGAPIMPWFMRRSGA
jgi:hypothetical protein